MSPTHEKIDHYILWKYFCHMLLHMLEQRHNEEELKTKHLLWNSLSDAFLELYGRRQWSTKCHLLFEHIGKNKIESNVYYLNASRKCSQTRKFEGNVGIWK